MFGPDLFNSLTPPTVHVLLEALTSPEDDTRKVVVAIRPQGGRRMEAYLHVSRYSPEATILRAIGETLTALEVAQGQVTREALQSTLELMAFQWVEPF